MDTKVFAIIILGIMIVIGGSVLNGYNKERTKQAAIQAIEHGADADTVNRILEH